MGLKTYKTNLIENEFTVVFVSFGTFSKTTQKSYKTNKHSCKCCVKKIAIFFKLANFSKDPFFVHKMTQPIIMYSTPPIGRWPVRRYARLYLAGVR